MLRSTSHRSSYPSRASRSCGSLGWGATGSASARIGFSPRCSWAAVGVRRDTLLQVAAYSRACWRTWPLPEIVTTEALALNQSIAAVLLHIYAMRMAAVFTISTTTIGLRTGLLPRWLAFSGYATSLILLLGIRVTLGSNCSSLSGSCFLASTPSSRLLTIDLPTGISSTRLWEQPLTERDSRNS